ncbi:U3 small nucleolar RNA-associated protein 6 domain containing protein [Elaphomyces granulatus]|jgi:U3 small nucleolar RNA-associated protein 6
MTATSDKARFYLEKSVPELKEYEQKKIFSKEEILSITRKRSDFEHKLNARGSKPTDYARYVEYEMNLDLLRRKRVKRLGIKTAAHTGQRRIFFILNRATKKFHGDIALWVQYIEYARQQKAYKKLTQIFGDALRLHPANADLWIYAAKYALDEHADMTLARTYMQRGLRFCKNSKLLWIQYAKLELIYITKIALRRQVLGLDQSSNESAKEEAIDDLNDDMIPLPRITAEDVNPSLGKDDDVDHGALQNLQAAPVLSGAIPMAIFDAAMKEFNNDPAFGHDFFNMVLQFEEIPRLAKILEKVVEKLLATSPASHHTRICHIRIPAAGINVTSSDFPRAFGGSLSRLKQYPLDSSLAQEMIKWLRPLMEIETLDPALRTVVAATLRKSERATQAPSR